MLYSNRSLLDNVPKGALSKREWLRIFFVKLQATKARNEYLLNMDAANSSIQKYFVDDLSDLIDCMDYGFHQVILIWMIIFFVKLHEIMIIIFLIF